MTTPKREIYSIGFNRSFTDKGELRMFHHTVGIMSVNMKIPEKIVEEGYYIVVTFEDKSRHRLPLSGGIEIMDRVIEPIKKQIK